MITFKHVTRNYASVHKSGGSLRTLMSFKRNHVSPDFTALDDVSFHLPRGGALGIIGGNGAGKSTLLKLLTRVERPSEGQIIVRGNVSSLLEVGAGFHHDLNAIENIHLSGAILGMTQRDIGLRLDDIISFAGLEGYTDQPVRTFSSGMFLRLAFSIGIHLNSDILVIDEALAVGDATFQARCLASINNFRKSGGTIVLVSHDSNQLRGVCDRGLVLQSGRCKFDGEISEALTFYSTIEGR